MDWLFAPTETGDAKPVIVDGGMYWFVGHAFHRDDGAPAYVKPNEHRWYVHGVSCRENDLPSVMSSRCYSWPVGRRCDFPDHISFANGALYHHGKNVCIL